ncbi:MAG TPA: multiheme c-type cytochrome [Bryobacteraceae bacterium]|nr:multiheme c-type cytochrome [Bryobacteraceae bacterium]
MRLRYIIPSLLAAALIVPLGSVYYHYESGAACARCHEIQPAHNQWRSSSHRGVACSNCHGSALTLDVGFHWTNLRRAVNHFRGREAEEIRLTHRDLFPIAERCATCHRQEFAQWQAGPHSATYGRIFLNPEHNTQRKLMDDCLRCHGMHFDGAMRDLVAPVAAKGPWKLLQPELTQRPAIPCLSCHHLHSDGSPLEKRPLRAAAAGQEVIRPSVSLYDRREQLHVPVRLLGIPVMKDGDRVVKMSPDPRQALCYQCHAPLASAQAGSGDDRTGVGVHEGISCLTCHAKHSQQTGQSCKTCHPKMSNCGLDVEKMDTSFKDKKSKFNVHTVKCADCHPKGIPPKRTRTAATD